jgi:C4-dicarboxylate transporter, DctQ subunit
MTMSHLALLWGRLHRIAEALIVLLLASMFASFLIQIVFRYFLNLPLGWTVEFVTIAWLWGILFGYAFVLRDDEVIRLDIVYLAVPTPAQRAMDFLSSAVVAGILVWSLPQIYNYISFMKIERTAFLKIRFDHLFAIYIPFVLAVVVRSLRTCWRALKGQGYGPTASSEAAENV